MRMGVVQRLTLVLLIVSLSSWTHEDANAAFRDLYGVSEILLSTWVETSRASFLGKWVGMGNAMAREQQNLRSA